MLLAADQIRAGQHVAPLIVAAHLQTAAVVLKELQEVVALHQHVVELQEGQAALQTLLVALGRQHAVDGKQRADIADEIDIAQAAQPVGVVDDQRLVVAKLDKAGQLRLDAGDVVIDGFHGHHLAHIGFAAGVANHGRCTAHQGDGLVARALHVRHGDDGDEVAEVQAGGGGVKAYVEGSGFALQLLVQIVFKGYLGDESAFLQGVKNMHMMFLLIV